MAQGAADLLDRVREELAPRAGENRLIGRIEDGGAPRHVLAELAAQESRIIVSDRRSFLLLAARCADAPGGDYFTELAAGEAHALTLLEPFAVACGSDLAALRARPPLAGCQAYPAYLAWLALNGDPSGVVLALTANFAAWGDYCAATARALRHRYGFDDDACAFFDFFATPAPDTDARALAAVAERQSGISRAAAAEASEYGRLLQSYELMFWNTLADLDG